MNSDVRRDFCEILGQRLLLCDTRLAIQEYPSLHSSWDGSIDVDPWFREFYLQVFLPPVEANRAIRGMRAVREFFGEIAQRHYEETGKVVEFPENFVRELERRVLISMYPSSYEVATIAKTRSGKQIAIDLKRLEVTEAEWRKKYL